MASCRVTLVSRLPLNKALPSQQGYAHLYENLDVLQKLGLHPGIEVPFRHFTPYFNWIRDGTVGQVRIT